MSDEPFEPTPIRDHEPIDTTFRRLFAEIVEHYNRWLSERHDAG